MLYSRFLLVTYFIFCFFNSDSLYKCTFLPQGYGLQRRQSHQCCLCGQYCHCRGPVGHLTGTQRLPSTPAPPYLGHLHPPAPSLQTGGLPCCSGFPWTRNPLPVVAGVGCRGLMAAPFPSPSSQASLSRATQLLFSSV